MKKKQSPLSNEIPHPSLASKLSVVDLHIDPFHVDALPKHAHYVLTGEKKTEQHLSEVARKMLGPNQGGKKNEALVPRKFDKFAESKIALTNMAADRVSYAAGHLTWKDTTLAQEGVMGTTGTFKQGTRVTKLEYNMLRNLQTKISETVWVKPKWRYMAEVLLERFYQARHAEAVYWNRQFRQLTITVGDAKKAVTQQTHARASAMMVSGKACTNNLNLMPPGEEEDPVKSFKLDALRSAEYHDWLQNERDTIAQSVLGDDGKLGIAVKVREVSIPAANGDGLEKRGLDKEDIGTRASTKTSSTSSSGLPEASPDLQAGLALMNELPLNLTRSTSLMREQSLMHAQHKQDNILEKHFGVALYGEMRGYAPASPITRAMLEPKSPTDVSPMSPMDTSSPRLLEGAFSNGARSATSSGAQKEEPAPSSSSSSSSPPAAAAPRGLVIEDLLDDDDVIPITGNAQWYLQRQQRLHDKKFGLVQGEKAVVNQEDESPRSSEKRDADSPRAADSRIDDDDFDWDLHSVYSVNDASSDDEPQQETFENKSVADVTEAQLVPRLLFKEITGLYNIFKLPLCAVRLDQSWSSPGYYPLMLPSHYIQAHDFKTYGEFDAFDIRSYVPRVHWQRAAACLEKSVTRPLMGPIDNLAIEYRAIDIGPGTQLRVELWRKAGFSRPALDKSPKSSNEDSEEEEGPKVNIHGYLSWPQSPAEKKYCVYADKHCDDVCFRPEAKVPTLGEIQQLGESTKSPRSAFRARHFRAADHVSSEQPRFRGAPCTSKRQVYAVELKVQHAVAYAPKSKRVVATRFKDDKTGAQYSELCELARKGDVLKISRKGRNGEHKLCVDYLDIFVDYHGGVRDRL